MQGFYDGDGSYQIRCMPTHLGTWSYTTTSNVEDLDGQTGSFICIAPSKANYLVCYPFRAPECIKLNAAIFRFTLVLSDLNVFT